MHLLSTGVWVCWSLYGRGILPWSPSTRGIFKSTKHRSTKFEKQRDLPQEIKYQPHRNGSRITGTAVTDEPSGPASHNCQQQLLERKVQNVLPTVQVSLSPLQQQSNSCSEAARFRYPVQNDVAFINSLLHVSNETIQREMPNNFFALISFWPRQ